MKALSLKQPWAGLIADGQKTIETRIWPTDYRGDLLICASLNVDKFMMDEFTNLFSEGNLLELFAIKGHALCVVELYDCQIMIKEHEAAAMCDVYGEGRWKAKSFFLRNIRRIKPFPVKGQLGIFDVDIKPEEIIYL